MEIFPVRQETVADDRLGADAAGLVRGLEGTLAADELVVHRDDLPVDDGLTEGAPDALHVEDVLVVLSVTTDLHPVPVHDGPAEGAGGAGGRLVAGLAVRLVAVNVELDGQQVSAVVTLETLSVVVPAPSTHSILTHRLETVAAGTYN